MSEDKKSWGWYIGRDGENYTSGPETYEAAVRIAREEYEGAHICEAYKAPVSLASMFDADDWLARCEEGFGFDYMGESGDLLFDLTPEQIKSLQESVRAALDEWQSASGITFMPYIFTEARNHQYISADAETES